MKNQYFGDRRDLFKYDLLLDVVEARGARRLTFIPMLAPPDESGEGRLTAADKGARRAALYEFLMKCVQSGRRDIRQLREFMPTLGVTYLPFRDDTYFIPGARPEYFGSVPLADLADSVVFFDPDVGLETGTHSYMRSRGLEKYLLHADLATVWAQVPDDSVVVVYQHLQKDDRKRAGDVRRKVDDLQSHLKARAWAVRWNDLALIAAVRDEQVACRICCALGRHAARHRREFFDGAA